MAIPLAMAAAGGYLAWRGIQKARNSISFGGRVVLITGGSRGLGLVIGRELAREGARLAIVARDDEEVKRGVEDLAARGAEVLGITADVTDAEQVQDIVRRVMGCLGPIDVLINNAGVISMGPIDHMTRSDFEEAMAAHFWGPLYMTQAVIPHMRLRGGGRIVNIASIGGLIGVPHLAPYCASKFALVGLSESLRAELAEDGIKVTTVCPGFMRTGSHLNARFKGRHREEFAWFSLIGTCPATSINVQRAARKIIEACRHGDSQLVITMQAKLGRMVHDLLPSMFADVMALANKAMPAVSLDRENQSYSGWESASAAAPSTLTRLGDRAAVENNEVPMGA